MTLIINVQKCGSIKVTKSGTATVCKIMPSPFLYQWKYLQLRGEMGVSTKLSGYQTNISSRTDNHTPNQVSHQSLSSMQPR